MSPPKPTGQRQLLLVFRLPENPSRYRVSVWRRLRRFGARVVHRAVFLLPDTPLNRLRAGDLAHDVENWGGTASIFTGSELASLKTKELESLAATSRGERRITRSRKQEGK